MENLKEKPIEKPKAKPIKYEIEKEFKEKLKIYFLIVRPANISPIQNERAIGVVAYKTDEAIKKAQQNWSAPGMVIISHGDYVLMDEILSKVNVEGLTIIEAPQIRDEIQPGQIIQPRMGIQGFKEGLLLAMNEYVKEEEDKKSLKRIIENIDETNSN